MILWGVKRREDAMMVMVVMEESLVAGNLDCRRGGNVGGVEGREELGVKTMQDAGSFDDAHQLHPVRQIHVKLPVHTLHRNSPTTMESPFQENIAQQESKQGEKDKGWMI